MGVLQKLSKFFRHPVVVLPLVTVLIIASWLQFAKQPNYLDVIKDSSNLIDNGSFETADDTGFARGWTVSQNGQLSHESSLVKGYIGKTSARLDVKDYVSGLAYVVSPVVRVEKDKQYFFKSHYATDTIVDLYLQTINQDGTTKRTHLKHLPDYDYPWSAMEASFVAESEEVQIIVAVSDNGYIELDGAYVIRLDTVLQQNHTVVGVNLMGTVPSSSWYVARNGIGNVQSSIEADQYKINITDYQSGEASWKGADIPALSHAPYKLSFSYNTDMVVSVFVDYLLADGSYTYRRLSGLQPSPGWASVSIDFETPAQTVAMMPSVQLSSNGYLETKGVSVNSTGSSQTFDKPRISITFDDGWLSSYTNGAELLDKYDFDGTFYINPASLARPEIMEQSQVKDLLARGFQIASHSNEHIDITSFTRDYVRKDLVKASEDLTRLGVSGPLDYASPYGKYDQAVLLDVMSEYVTHRGTEIGINTKNNINYKNLKGLFMRKELTDLRLGEMLAETKSTNGWLILIYHQIEASESPFALDRDTLIRQLEMIKASGIEVQTVRRAVEETNR